MPIPNEVLELENHSSDVNGELNLASAYRILKQMWDAGNRDRELILHLMFLAWYGLCEPPHITGFHEEAISNELVMIFNQVHEYVQSTIANDVEMLYVVGLMAHLFPHLLGDHDVWLRRSEEYRLMYRALKPNGIEPSIFQNRGAYGEYFGSQAKVVNGY